MTIFYKHFIYTIIILFVATAQLNAQCDSGQLGWLEVAAIFSDNNCTGCHGFNSGVSGLDLTTYNAFLLGGVKCGSEITTGTTLVEIITTNNYAGCANTLMGQSMNNRVMGAMDSLEILNIQRWITAELPENCENFCIVNELISITLNNEAYHFNVDSNLTANNSILNGSLINYEAGSTISLSKGFSVDVSSDFYAFIGDCDF